MPLFAFLFLKERQNIPISKTCILGNITSIPLVQNTAGTGSPIVP